MKKTLSLIREVDLLIESAGLSTLLLEIVTSFGSYSQENLCLELVTRGNFCPVLLLLSFWV